MCPSNWLAEAVTISLGDRFEEGFSGRVEYGHFESEGLGNRSSRRWDGITGRYATYCIE